MYIASVCWASLQAPELSVSPGYFGMITRILTIAHLSAGIQNEYINNMSTSNSKDLIAVAPLSHKSPTFRYERPVQTLPYHQKMVHATLLPHGLFVPHMKLISQISTMPQRDIAKTSNDHMTLNFDLEIVATHCPLMGYIWSVKQTRGHRVDTANMDKAKTLKGPWPWPFHLEMVRGTSPPYGFKLCKIWSKSFRLAGSHRCKDAKTTLNDSCELNLLDWKCTCQKHSIRWMSRVSFMKIQW